MILFNNSSLIKIHLKMPGRIERFQKKLILTEQLFICFFFLKQISKKLLNFKNAFLSVKKILLLSAFDKFEPF